MIIDADPTNFAHQTFGHRRRIVFGICNLTRIRKLSRRFVDRRPGRQVFAHYDFTCTSAGSGVIRPINSSPIVLWRPEWGVLGAPGFLLPKRWSGILLIRQALGHFRDPRRLGL